MLRQKQQVFLKAILQYFKIGGVQKWSWLIFMIFFSLFILCPRESAKKGEKNIGHFLDTPYIKVL